MISVRCNSYNANFTPTISAVSVELKVVISNVQKPIFQFTPGILYNILETFGSLESVGIVTVKLKVWVLYLEWRLKPLIMVWKYAINNQIASSILNWFFKIMFCVSPAVKNYSGREWPNGGNFTSGKLSDIFSDS